jgi:nucleoside-diphosphate-sugar epimerase
MSKGFFFGIGELQKTTDSLGNCPEHTPDYIVHLASPTSSKFFVEHPAETRTAILDGTERILQLVRRTRPKMALFFSSNEVYGEISSEKPLREEQLGFLNQFAARSSYPLAKRLSEKMVQQAGKNEGLNVSNLRLGVCTGTGVQIKDERIYTKMAVLAGAGLDIRLATSGESKLTMISVGDTIAGILTAWLKAEPGETYNLANEANFYSVVEIANMIRDHFVPEISVLTNCGGETQIFAQERKILQDCSKMRALGWTPTESTLEIYRKLIEFVWAIKGLRD